MKQDKRLKDILLNSADSTSSDFADRVMNKIFEVQAARPGYQPLVPARVIRAFLFISGAVITAILGLCLMISFTETDVVRWMQSMELPELKYSSFVLYIVIFWIMFWMNVVVGRVFDKNRGGSVVDE